jgi:hypothetical protein
MEVSTPLTLANTPYLTSTEINLNDDTGIAERFSTGFKRFITSQKRQAVVAFLQAEFPKWSDNENFIADILSHLKEDSVIAEKRFVFLSINPKYTFV